MGAIIPDDYEATIKEKICVEGLNILKGIKRNDTAPPSSIFRNVMRGNPDEIDLEPLQSPYAFFEESVDDVQTAEMYTGLVYSRFMSVIVHVRFSHPEDEVEPLTAFNYYIGEIQKAFFANPKFNDTCQDIDEVSQSPEIYRLDRLYGGYIVFRVKYRHARNNPHVRR